MALGLPSRISTINSSDRKSERTVGRRFQSVIVMLLVSGFLFGAVGSRLAQLQLVEGDRNRQRA
ncbi:MAG: hypothetical protein AAGH78_17885, partial [Cyanobacteria bacterium P01_H01_bin.58]